MNNSLNPVECQKVERNFFCDLGSFTPLECWKREVYRKVEVRETEKYRSYKVLLFAFISYAIDLINLIKSLKVFVFLSKKFDKSNFSYEKS